MLADREETVNPARTGLYGSGSDSPGERRGRDKARPQDEPDELGTFARPVSLLLACARVKSPDGDRHPFLVADRGPEALERRVTPRHEHIRLSDSERVRVRQMTAKALGCRVAMVSMTRSADKGSSVVQSRLVMAVPCGTRMCEVCDAERRKREAARVEGHWRLFWTVGVPSGAWRADVAWRLMGTWVKALFRELRRELASGEGARVRVGEDERERIAALNAARRVGARKAALLQYAWCLEPHISGWPHLHFVTNAEFVNFDWLKAVWGRIVSAEIRWARFEKVTDRDGICRYLSKYISKTTFSPDITAIMYRRRQWASTVPKPKVAKVGWELETETKARDLFLETVEPDAVARVEGWEAKLARPGEYALFERVFSREEWALYQRTKHQCDRFDRTKVYIEDVDWDDHEQHGRARVEAMLELQRAMERRRRGISWDGARGDRELASSLMEEARGGIVKS